MRAAASPNQVLAYFRWLLGGEKRVCPPSGQPPGTSLFSASMKNGGTSSVAVGNIEVTMPLRSRQNQRLTSGSLLGVNGPCVSGIRTIPVTVVVPSISPEGRVDGPFNCAGTKRRSTRTSSPWVVVNGVITCQPGVPSEIDWENR